MAAGDVKREVGCGPKSNQGRTTRGGNERSRGPSLVTKCLRRLDRHRTTGRSITADDNRDEEQDERDRGRPHAKYAPASRRRPFLWQCCESGYGRPATAYHTLRLRPGIGRAAQAAHSQRCETSLVITDAITSSRHPRGPAAATKRRDGAARWEKTERSRAIRT